MEHKHKHAIHSFLKSWQERSDYLGALLTGSIATGTADSGSDIDLRILYSGDQSIHEVGECMIAGQVISFLGTNKSGYLKLFAADMNTTSKFEIRRFAVGKIIEDSNAQLQQLIDNALIQLAKPLATFAPMEVLVEKMKLTRKYKVLVEMPLTDSFFSMAYYDLLQQLFQFYAKFLQVDVPAFIKKKSRYFTNENYRTIHQFQAFPDEIFVRLYLSATATPQLAVLEKIYQHILQRSGGFPDTNFMARFTDNYQEVGLFALD